MSLLTTVIDRWKSETPKFFKGVKNLSLTLGTAAASVWGINSMMNLELPQIILDVCKYAIAVAAAMGFTAQLTKVNSQP